MNRNVNDGGPAYPILPPVDSEGQPPAGAPFASVGMSLRDRIAIEVLPWCLSEFAGNAEDQTQPCEAAYQIADMMLKVREVK